MRGKLFSTLADDAIVRITPAGAGKTRRINGHIKQCWDHPRRCGENISCLAKRTTRLGSPPQVRGKLYRAAGIAEKYRITPAGAGKTCKKCSQFSQYWDHPRRCGENAGETDEDHAAAGSPPQVRGKRNFVLRIPDRRRITPAGAGKTLYWLSRWAVCRDHPRRCGENLYRAALLVQRRGSPPQVRGKPVLSEIFHSVPRITPAGAGKTTQRLQRT